MTPSSASSPIDADVVILGAGIAGASLAWWLAPHARVVVLERESQPGYHSTGRSAAQFIASYGPPQVRALSRASLPFLLQPPAGFTEHPLLTRRSALTVAAPGQEALLDETWALLQGVGARAERLDAAQARALCPALRPEQTGDAILEVDSFDIDVHALHQGWLRGLRRHGGQLLTDAEAATLQHDGQRWQVVTTDGRHVRAPVVVNAAGAWCDVVAARAGVAPIGLVPKRRTAFTFRADAGLGDVAGWPMVLAVDHAWYLKPDAGLLLGSPANADPVAPQDVQPEDLDIAIGMDRLETATTLAVRPVRAWAGLRSFVDDGELVGGFDARAPGFFWCAAQGGYGIQTSAAMGEACAALVRGLALPAHLTAEGVAAAALSPRRLGTG
jgi:D-arginine dehydrogenase